MTTKIRCEICNETIPLDLWEQALAYLRSKGANEPRPICPDCSLNIYLKNRPPKLPENFTETGLN